jgi:hypothetical protein
MWETVKNLNPTPYALHPIPGSDFREKVNDEDGEINQDEFDKIWIQLRVLARSSPIDKLTLVTGIQNSRASTPQVPSRVPLSSPSDVLVCRHT